jgi:hypothetical protein
MSFSLDKKYKAHRIHPAADQSLISKKWTPRADVSWEENGKWQHETLRGPRDRCETFPQAINYALQNALTWIEDKAAQKKSA